MSTVKIYGIKNCDTMKKALSWLDEHHVDYTFYDYKKEGADEDVLRTALDQCGWESVINCRGTTWRQLPEDVKNTMDAKGAIRVALENPSIIKRPLLVYDGVVCLGFKADRYTEIF